MADKNSAPALAPVKYSQLVDQTAMTTGNTPARVVEITDVFVKDLLDALTAGHKVRLGELGVMRGRVGTNGGLSIKYAPAAPSKGS